jgi:hypothetical protein
MRTVKYLSKKSLLGNLFEIMIKIMIKAIRKWNVFESLFSQKSTLPFRVEILNN